MHAPCKAQQLNTHRRHRWAVWVDGHRPAVVASKVQAKKLCSRAKESAYFCRWNQNFHASNEINRASISDFVIWQVGSDGRFFRYVYLLPEATVTGAGTQPFGFSVSPTDRERYERVLANPSLWKLGHKELLAAFNGYPDCLVEVTADSDMGMTCAGYRCVGEASTISELRGILDCVTPGAAYYGTVDATALRLWEKFDG